MSAWGENEPGIEAEPAPAEEQPAAVDVKPARPRERREPGRAFGIDLGEMTSDFVTAAFHKALRKQVTATASKAAEEAVGSLLDEDVLDDLVHLAHRVRLAPALLRGLDRVAKADGRISVRELAFEAAAMEALAGTTRPLARIV